MNKENSLDKIMEILELEYPKLGANYELYKSYFPELEFDKYIKLEKNGMLGRLFRGQRIDLVKENIHIPFCWWRHAIFKDSNQYTPYVVKSKNRYWNQ